MPNTHSPSRASRHYPDRDQPPQPTRKGPDRMRKPRDIDAELKALHDKQKQLRARRVIQFGELVIATGADALDPETLAGALLDAVERAKANPGAKEAWRRRGDGFFRRERRAKPNGAGDAHAAVAHDGNGCAPYDGFARAGPRSVSSSPEPRS